MDWRQIEVDILEGIRHRASFIASNSDQAERTGPVGLRGIPAGPAQAGG